VAWLAGFVDITGYLLLDGYFVSFMSGNTTLLARDLATGSARVAVPALLIVGFVVGVVLGTIVGDRKPQRRKVRVSLLLVAGLIATSIARALGQVELALGTLVVTMGAINTVLSPNRANPVGLTYMTGALMRTGQIIADRLGGNRQASPLPFALLWVSLAFGALCGALVETYFAPWSLWVASLAAILLAIGAYLIRTLPDQPLS